MLTATTAGRGGSLFTLHASPPTDGARRVEALSLIVDLEPPHSHDSQLRPWPRDPGPGTRRSRAYLVAGPQSPPLALSPPEFGTLAAPLRRDPLHLVAFSRGPDSSW